MREKQTVGSLIKQINTLYEKDFNLRLKGLGITSSQCDVLKYLFESGEEFVNQHDIEKALSLKNPTVTGILKRLDAKGFVIIVQNRTDKRCKNVYLTDKAYGIQRRMELDRKRIDKNLTLKMTEKEVAALTRALEKVLYNVQEP
ncbi:MAG: MarR family transcriptional regulator [Lachnospiraceae bacterium]|jgi:DNA-binding MarR family transcriptional regulator|nr:MarR family transcriptional regulator [Lachnospiraceae bacterium]